MFTAFEESQILTGMKNAEPIALRLYYKKYYPIIERMIRQNQGSEADAEDIFQETTLILLRKLEEDTFQLTSALSTFLYSISRHLWLMQLRKKRKFVLTAEADLPETALASDVMPENEEHSLLEKLAFFLTKLSLHCQLLIKSIFFQEKKMEEVQVEFGYTTKHNAQNQKYKCLQMLRKAAAK